MSTRPHSVVRDQSVSSVDEDDLRGASRITGGVFRGRAHGNTFNFADGDDMDVDDGYYKVDGKVLLYTSRDDNARPTMTITHPTSSELPPILKALAHKFSPIRSKQVLLLLVVC
jgi:hypothetical protein